MSAKWSGSKFCLATQEVRQAVLDAELNREEIPGPLWMEVMRRCFARGLFTSVTCIGVTRGHSRL